MCHPVPVAPQGILPALASVPPRYMVGLHQRLLESVFSHGQVSGLKVDPHPIGALEEATN